MTKAIVSSLVGIALGCACSRAIFILAGSLVGAGHGIGSPFIISGAPAAFFFFLAPVATAAVFSYWRPAVLCGLAMFVVHYAANIVNWPNLARLRDDYLYLPDGGQGGFWQWLVAYASLNVLVWVVGLQRLAAIRRRSGIAP